MATKISEIEPLSTLSEINRRGDIKNIILLARKFLPDECVLVLGPLLRLEAIMAVYQAKNSPDGVSLEKICRHCEFSALCPVPRKN